MIMHFNGTSWKTQSSGTTGNLNSVWGTGPTNVYAVGDGLSWQSGVLLRYDGKTWTIAKSNVLAYKSVWGSSPTDVYVAGSAPPAHGFIQHYDGKTWSHAAAMMLMPLQVVWGTSSTSVYAAGYNNTLLHYPNK